mmetsp:Transcript_10928/g.16891  ORF Transcript_10928/g.16891 Transcript_10928/m.16891 type:complete len:591 (+) Transcript_10928:158-1930(+)
MVDKKRPNENTIADGYSLNDERKPVTGPELDFDYGCENEPEEDGETPPYNSGLAHHLPDADMPKLRQTHEGEHHGDLGNIPVSITKSAYLYTLCAAINSCNLGYDIGVNTNAAPLVQSDLELTDVQLEIFVGAINLFAMFGALASQTISDQHGRRKTFLLAAFSFIIGSGIQSIAQSYMVLMFGRVFVGLAVGIGLAIDPLYISEMVPATHRGELVTWAETALQVGIVLGFSTGFVFSSVPDETAWRYMFGCGIFLPSLMVFLSTFIMPETPRWLVVNERENEARHVLTKIYPVGYDVNPVVDDIKESVKREVLAEQNVGWDVILFPSPAFKRILVVGIGIAIAQQAVGIDAIQYFLVYILDETGIKSREEQSAVLMFIGIVKLLCILIAGKLLDLRGRRPLFFVSLCGIAGSCLLLSINFYGSSYSASFAIFGLSLYMAFFALGMGPGGWLVPAEVFPTCIRGKAISISAFMNRVTATLMASTFLSTAKAMTWAGFFFLLAIIACLVLLFIYYFVPETKGRSLEDMSIYFAEITGDMSLLETEEKLVREREVRESEVEVTTISRTFTPPTARDIPPEALQDATVVGTMS